MIKNTHIVLLALLLVTGCRDIENSTQEKKKEQLERIAPQHQNPSPSAPLNEVPVKPIKKDRLDSVFIGKTTQELNQYELHQCFGTLIETTSENEKYAVSQYALNREECGNGKSKILLEKLLGYDDERKANFAIKDELIVNQNHQKYYYASVNLKLDGDQVAKNYLVAYKDNANPTIAKIYKLWKINLSRGKFTNIEVPRNLTFDNPNYADGI
ncbi:hypothetical protein [Sphingobacterium bambusae]|uniref:Lipoprotein n=1 Tax=Sphingobacterium bambusae TaxID=662858 RepID=A0ABW6BNT0_9SPHI|nr:hypothetical protein [Sphingobacterium bambusae]WPL48169.1 hypothetical protein SCB77_19635 [Sphingobacterium bambusae]